ncbi:hypothetical protein MUA77_10715 [Mammaliicoccus sciuri]|uniref:hypothetical protein n=1 Tax=Mammaliicoccus sciuri TaxID=1296 RepID=UPI0021D23E88|nr:hypothetical protein [Mammaliicoccus sciuri]UXU83275.1 hypothetical protein MUA77_10715 [Mammaliicoccus sciuri]UXU93122.1 hypothetical protein MUA42_10725 [Mammaliicoccus sciuri]UXV15073.1 hypothetical protein MUA89_10995 [Mammaliicoccus sciuri]UXV23336.1 hypothetical protein MUA49_10725 [Mammaliicoccus sciuri]UXV26114.1 hypothetical protein MUA96_10980 [Mammaliicoccus sciuri]
MTNKAYIEFYIDWYCMFFHLYDYEVNFGSDLYGEFKEEFQKYFNNVQLNGNQTTFFGINKEQSEERVKKIKNNTHHCLYELYHMLKDKKIYDLLFDPKEHFIEFQSNQPSYCNSVLHDLVKDYFYSEPYYPYSEILNVPVTDADQEIIDAYRKVFAGVDVKTYLSIDEHTNRTYELHITLDKEEESRQKIEAYEKENNIIL